MRDVAAELGRALRARAAHGSAVRVPLDRRAADGAHGRQAARHGVLRALFRHDRKNFRDDLARLADGDGVADADILFGNEVLIVECCACDRCARQPDGADDSARRQDAGPPDLHDDVLHKGLTNFGRIFIGAGPAWEFRRAAELRALRQAVELDHRAVDVKGKAVACLADPGNAPQGLIRRGAARVRDNMKAQRLQEFQRLDMRRELPPLGKLEVKDENIQPPLRLALLLARLVELREDRAGHEDLAADDETVRRAVQMHGNGADRLEIFRHVLADAAVAARCAADERAVHILQRDGQAVDLRLDAVDGVRHALAHPAVKFADLVRREHVLQTLERHGVLDLFKLAQRLAADPARGRERRCQLRMRGLQLLQPPQQPVIFIILHLGRIEHIVLMVRPLQHLGQVRDLFAWVHVPSSSGPPSPM